jgi:hypothetical protein
MRRLSTFLLLVIFACETFAAVSGSLAANITRSGNVYSVTSGVVTGGKVATSAAVTVGGNVIQMPGKAGIGTLAVSALSLFSKTTPLAIAATVVVPFLLSYGLEYANNQWNKRTPAAVRYNVQGAGLSPNYSTPDAACKASNPTSYAAVAWNGGRWVCYSANGVQGADINSFCAVGSRAGVFPNYSCPSDTPTNAPATDADWDVVNALSPTAIPDAVWNEVIPKIPGGLPVDAPVLDPKSDPIPMGAPYIDPTTGKTKQDVCSLQPSPMPGDPLRVDVRCYTQDVTAADPAKVDPKASTDPAKATDPCIENPDRAGCFDAGTPDDVSLPTEAVSMILTPVGVGNAGTCPVNKTFTHAGQTFTFNHKPICDFASAIKPLVLALAWLSAAFIVAGAMKET